MARLNLFLVVVALVAGMMACVEPPPDPAPPLQYNLIIWSNGGGSVIAPGQWRSTYDAGTVVDLVAQAEEGHRFLNWSCDVYTIANVNAASTTITMDRNCLIIASFLMEIWDWHDLSAIRDNLNGNYLLMNDLDSSTAGYTELASLTANGGEGWEPIGYTSIPWYDPTQWAGESFRGAFDGQAYEITGLFINRPDDTGVGLFGFAGEGGVIKNVNVVSATVAGKGDVGGLVGANAGTVTNSYSTGAVTGEGGVGGLVGRNGGTVSNSYSIGSVTGGFGVGGLVGWNGGTVSNAYYDYDGVLINGKNIITIGALFGEDFEHWLANDRFLDVNERLSQENGYYVINDVSDFKQLLAFGQDESLRFKLRNDLDLATEADFYVPYLAGEFDGNGHKIRNLSFNLFVPHAGLFGYLASGAKVTQLGVENVNVTGRQYVGGLAGYNTGTVGNSYSTGSVTATYGTVGGLVGSNGGAVSNSYSTASVTGQRWVGGLVGDNWKRTVSNSYSTGSVTGESDVGGLVGRNYQGTVSSSFWDTETSGQATSAGGIGKTTAEMHDMAAFIAAAWEITAVAPGETATTYTWNIVDGQTYPFLSWQSVS